MNNIENKKGGSAFAFWSFVLGILSILPIVGILTAVLSIIFGSIAIRSKKRTSLAITGIVIALLFSISINTYTFFLVSKGQDKLREYQNSAEYQNRLQK